MKMMSAPKATIESTRKPMTWSRASNTPPRPVEATSPPTKSPITQAETQWKASCTAVASGIFRTASAKLLQTASPRTKVALSLQVSEDLLCALLRGHLGGVDHHLSIRG